MAATVYVETTIASYLAARPSRDLVTATHQQLTLEWWANRRGAFSLYVSELAIAASHGVEYLLTWNIRHLANATMRRRIDTACREARFSPPVLCTPEELMEE